MYDTTVEKSLLGVGWTMDPYLTKVVCGLYFRKEDRGPLCGWLDEQSLWFVLSWIAHGRKVNKGISTFKSEDDSSPFPAYLIKVENALGYHADFRISDLKMTALVFDQCRNIRVVPQF